MYVFKREGSPFWYTEFEIGTRRFSRTTRCRAEREARVEARSIREKEAAKLREEAQPRQPLTLNQVFGLYRKHEVLAGGAAPEESDGQEQPYKRRKRKGRRGLSPNWAKEVDRYGKLILETVGGNTLVENVSDATVDEFARKMVEQGMGEYAFNRALAVWRRVHRLSSKRWKQRTHEVDWTDFLNEEEERNRHITHAEAQRLLAPPLNIEVACAIRWSLYTGTRKAETYSLIWPNVNFDKGTAFVIAKGGRKHTVWLSPQATELLKSMPRDRYYVFKHGNRRKEFDRALERAGIEDFRWHDLRHTAATWLRMAGVPLEVVQRFLGHSKLATTARYAHVVDPEVQAAVGKIPFLSPPSPVVGMAA